MKALTSLLLPVILLTGCSSSPTISPGGVNTPPPDINAWLKPRSEKPDNRNRKGYITRRYQCFPLAPLPEDRKYDSLPDLVLHPEQETIKCKEKHYSQPL